jgi:hypothetical protein
LKNCCETSLLCNLLSFMVILSWMKVNERQMWTSNKWHEYIYKSMAMQHTRRRHWSRLISPSFAYNSRCKWARLCSNDVFIVSNPIACVLTRSSSVWRLILSFSRSSNRRRIWSFSFLNSWIRVNNVSWVSFNMPCSASRWYWWRRESLKQLFDDSNCSIECKSFCRCWVNCSISNDTGCSF